MPTSRTRTTRSTPRPPTRTRQPTLPVDRHCIECGSQGPFRNEHALKCDTCLERIETERKEFQKGYHTDRGSAIKELIAAHQDEYDRLFAKHRKAREKGRPTR